ncbi:MAG: CoA transferase [Gammaproteobacteria bacterium]|nr:CoA transferase [Gammaproteobacteria bacterium]
MTSAFDQLFVVDLSCRFSGAFASRLFGDYGAEVVLIETESGHSLRHEPPFLEDIPGIERSLVHAFANWNKQSLYSLNPDDLTKIISKADVLVTTTTDSNLLDWYQRRLSADAVHLSITPHGLQSPLTNVPGNNLTMSARCGWASINGYGTEPPLAMPRNQCGIVGGVTGFISCSAALRRRNALPQAEIVDVSELDSFALTVHPWGVAGAYHGLEPRIGDHRTRPRGSPGPLWNLSDGRMNFGLADFKNWTQAMEALNLPELGARENLIPDIGRHSQDLRDVVYGLASTLPKLARWDVFHQLTQLRCVVGVVQDMQDLIANEQVLAREFIERTTVNGRCVSTSGAPTKSYPSRWKLRCPAPRLGSTSVSKLQPHRRRKLEAVSISKADLAKGPLADVRVLSFGQAWSGTFATELLALLGADVVQVASHYHPDAFRRISNRVPTAVVNPDNVQHPRNTQGHYNSVNLHKREITLDIRSERGREILWRLMPHYEILVDNFRPGVLPSWGVTLEKLHEIRKGMIWASISGYGESGPYRDYPANGATTEPMSGFSSIFGYEGDAGMNSGGLYPDPISGYFLVAGVLAALAHRDKTGMPQRVDLSMMEAVSATLGDYIMESSTTHIAPQPLGNRHQRHVPHGVFPTKDQYWVAIAVETDSMWNALVEVLADTTLSKQEYQSESARRIAEDSINSRVCAWTQARSADDVELALNTKGICAARVVPLIELYKNPPQYFIDSGFIRRINHPEAGLTWLPGRPWQFSGAKQIPIRPAPCVGQHSREVFTEELGIDASTYEEWVKEGITGTMDEIT